jgi:hypothetical protein
MNSNPKSVFFLHCHLNLGATPKGVLKFMDSEEIRRDKLHYKLYSFHHRNIFTIQILSQIWTTEYRDYPHVKNRLTQNWFSPSKTVTQF